MLKYPESLRHTNVPDFFKTVAGGPGPFMIRLDEGRGDICIIAATGEGWEHVSCHIKMPDGTSRIPSWMEMCLVKNIFWEPEDCVIQYHPPRSQYVNISDYTLHLWRPIGQTIPLPPKILV